MASPSPTSTPWESFFELLTGRPPYDGDSPVSIALKHAEAAVPSLAAIDPTIPAPVVAIVERAMAKDLAHRTSAPPSSRAT